jgi:hypothetical protein
LLKWEGPAKQKEKQPAFKVKGNLLIPEFETDL